MNSEPVDFEAIRRESYAVDLRATVARLTAELDRMAKGGENA